MTYMSGGKRNKEKSKIFIHLQESIYLRCNCELIFTPVTKFV